MWVTLYRGAPCFYLERLGGYTRHSLPCTVKSGYLGKKRVLCSVGFTGALTVIWMRCSTHVDLATPRPVL